MNHIISRFEFCKFMNLLSFVYFPPLFLLFLSENIRLRDHRKFQHRILIAFCHISISHKDLARIDLPLHIFAVKAAQVIISQIFCQTSCPGPGTRDQNHPVPIPLQTLQISCKKFKTVIIRIHTGRLNIIHAAHLKFSALCLQCCKSDAMTGIQHSGNFICLKHANLCLFFRKPCIFPVLQTVEIFLLHNLRSLQQPHWFIQKDQTFLFREIIQKRNCIRLLCPVFRSRIDHC